MRVLDASEIARKRAADEFFWADLDLAGETTVESIAEAFGIDEGAAAALGEFERAASPARKMHIDRDLIVFRFWCIGKPDADVLGGIEAIDPFQVNVALHGDYLLTVHRRPHDVPAEVSSGRIPEGRDERYAVYLALDGMTSTIFEAMANIELAVGELETGLLRSGLRPRSQDKEQIASLRDRLTGLRMRVGPQRALFERVGEEIDHVEGLKGDKGAYFGRIQTQLDRAVDRIDAASGALSHALEIQLNETTYRLTIVATIFLPLGFIVGFFGMNFAWMTSGLRSEDDFVLFGIAIWLVPLIAALLLRRQPQRGPAGALERAALAGVVAERRCFGPERGGDLVDRLLLLAGDPLAADPQEAAGLVGLGGVFGDRERELAVLGDLLRGRLRRQQADRLGDLGEAERVQLLLAGELLRVEIRRPGDDFADQVGRAVFLLRRGVRLRHRQALAHGPAALGGDHDQAGEGRAAPDRVPLVGVELGLGRHSCSRSLEVSRGD